MTARYSLYFLSILVALAAMGIPAFAEDDVTVISTPASTPALQKKTASTDDPAVIHKSSHKKKKTAVAATNPVTATPSTAPAGSNIKTETATMGASTTPTKTSGVTTAVTKTESPAVRSMPTKPQAAVAAAPFRPLPTVTSTPASTLSSAKPTTPTSTVITSLVSPISASGVIVTTPGATPTVETGLPVARYPGMGTPIRGVSTYTAAPVTFAPLPKNGNHSTLLASALPVSMLPLTSSATGSYSVPRDPNFTFTNFPQKPKMSYPWRSGIITTTFWIGEGDTPISHTTNVQSSWDEDWLSNNRGSDSPNNRNGYAAGNHASTLNPFYVALPFNDLAFPDKARRFLPGGWYRRPVDGRQVSACKDRWVEIKNGKGDICYAQWEDVGPLNYSDAEYVFGGQRPTGMGENHAGLDVSPAVAEYLNISDRNRMTAWRFVDDTDVRPGAWLKLDEQAVLYTALHQFKNGRAPTSELPIQKASEPIDENQTRSNKKKIDESKG